MIVEQIWTGNAYRNFNYLIVCPDSGEALAVDPLDHQKCLARAKAKGWQITQIVNTHEHGDHTGGNGPMIAATGAKLLAHKNAGARIDGIDRGLAAGDVIKVGKRVELLALDTPGHTMSHICLRFENRHAGADLRRYVVQCRRRQLSQRRPSDELYTDLRRPAREAARQHARVSRPRLHCQQPRFHDGPRTGQCEGRVAARRHQEGITIRIAPW